MCMFSVQVKAVSPDLALAAVHWHPKNEEMEACGRLRVETAIGGSGRIAQRV